LYLYWHVFVPVIVVVVIAAADVYVVFVWGMGLKGTAVENVGVHHGGAFLDRWGALQGLEWFGWHLVYVFEVSSLCFDYFFISVHFDIFVKFLFIDFKSLLYGILITANLIFVIERNLTQLK